MTNALHPNGQLKEGKQEYVCLLFLVPTGCKTNCEGGGNIIYDGGSHS